MLMKLSYPDITPGYSVSSIHHSCWVFPAVLERCGRAAVRGPTCSCPPACARPPSLPLLPHIYPVVKSKVCKLLTFSCLPSRLEDAIHPNHPPTNNSCYITPAFTHNPFFHHTSYRQTSNLHICVRNTNSFGLSTQPCGAPVFRKVLFLILTSCVGSTHQEVQDPGADYCVQAPPHPAS